MPGNDASRSDLAFEQSYACGRSRTGAAADRSVRTVFGMAGEARHKAARVIGNRLSLLGLAFVLASSPAHAEVIRNEIAVFAALDKVTGRINHLEIPMNQTVEFGALKVTPRVCDTRPPTEPPRTTSFVEVDETTLTGEVHRIFTGWMFAESPGLHAVEHPVFDVWLTSCKTNSAPASSGNNENAAAPEAGPDAAPEAAPAAAEQPAEPPPPAEAAPEPLPWAVPPPPNAASSNP
jgi:hypothetical protein